MLEWRNRASLYCVSRWQWPMTATTIVTTRSRRNHSTICHVHRQIIDEDRDVHLE
jgi:hypothetical protein